MSALLVAVLLAIAPALASQASDVQVSEYHRLHQEMGKLASRQAWSGVERAYQRMLETGVAPTSIDASLAAAAAMDRGDLLQARDRLLYVAHTDDTRDAIDMLYRIDTEYGRVTLDGGRELVAEHRPFLPEAAAAVDFATTQLEENGEFAGFLPPGRYRYGLEIIEVAAGVDSRFTSSRPTARRGRKKR